MVEACVGMKKIRFFILIFLRIFLERSVKKMDGLDDKMNFAIVRNLEAPFFFYFQLKGTVDI